ncbi:hypothetical protein BGZ95_007415 [Linnemannia exigua]|uniref:HCP-like protein n=1 Tax=Linnemannia exigua TaxID=604196 RepID=A0AAD4DHA7_9FUNG|nr:hypothetical protein BGZ95_007415 [Linnemannia exigua]
MLIKQRVQAVRPFYNITNTTQNNTLTTTATDADIVQVAVHLDPAGRAIVFWEDVLVAFKNALHIRQGSCILPFLRGSDYKLLYPLRIAAIPNRVLEVYIEEPSTRSSPNTQTATRMMHLVEEVMEDIVRRVSEYVLSQSGITPKSHISKNINSSNDDITTTVTAVLNTGNSENYIVSAEDGPSGNSSPQQRKRKAIRGNISSIHDSPLNVSLSKLSTSATTNDKSYPNYDQQLENLINIFESLMSGRRQDDTNSGTVSDKADKVASDSDTDAYTYTGTDDSIFRHSANSGKSSVGSPAIPHTQQVQQWSVEDIKDIPEDLRDVATKAMQGDIESQYSLAQSYNYGSNGLSQNDRLAMVWHGKAADQGHAESQYCMGEYYEEGVAVPKDYTKAMEWFVKSAGQGNCDAQYFIGSMYGRGNGVPKDENKAMEWFLKSARQGHHGAQYRIGLMYEYGKGVPQDKNKALEWHLKAANGGKSGAWWNVFSLRGQGYSVPVEE